MEITIGQGRGYVPVSQKDTKNLDLGRIAIDSLYTPIVDIGYNVEMTRVGDVTNYEELTITIETNGTISAKEAITRATRILMDHFALILEAGDVESATAPEASEEEAPEEQVEEEEAAPAEEAEEAV
jgi:DNA-directed RNA polymerase subunit alpha